MKITLDRILVQGFFLVSEIELVFLLVQVKNVIIIKGKRRVKPILLPIIFVVCAVITTLFQGFVLPAFLTESFNDLTWFREIHLLVLAVVTIFGFFVGLGQDFSTMRKRRAKKH